MSTKVCRKCGIEKPGTEFYRLAKSHDGLNNQCKLCRNALLAKLKKANPEKYRGYTRKFVAAHPEKASFTSRRWAANNPLKIKAKDLLNRALLAGRVERWPCEVCGELRVEAHHADYDNALGVTWLCLSHHRLLHAEHRKRHSGSALPSSSSLAVSQTATY